ncbi:hypothetical protein DFO70_1296 [Cytobacillus firmus]|uniref:Uncharacterized protein n=2 Tax=Cytobacillus TaxID=2675230 RepID=A0A366JGX1_CYTFI|nr:hypothetical protein DFO70_1296 [Cytobacillus firmus]TDX35878.1 hypothetical protein DFO72_1256 [Cytobacillus oceanisediminis]
MGRQEKGNPNAKRNNNTKVQGKVYHLILFAPYAEIEAKQRPLRRKGNRIIVIMILQKPLQQAIDSIHCVSNSLPPVPCSSNRVGFDLFFPF